MKDPRLIDPETGIKPIQNWGPECYRGFVRDSRFGPGQVIKGTNRNKTRKNIETVQRMKDAQTPLY